MASEDKLNISIEVCGRRFPLSIHPEQEEAIRASVVSVNQKVDAYKKKKKLENKDLTDILALIAVDSYYKLWLAERQSSESQVTAELRRISDEVDAILSEE